MEAFGRVITVCLAAVGVFFLSFCGRRSVLLLHKERTVQSLTRECAKEIMDAKYYSEERLVLLEKQLEQLGDFTVECVVLERVFYDTGAGRNEHYRVCDRENAQLSEGSFLRLCVTENRTKTETFFYGSGTIVLAGGRIS